MEFSSSEDETKSDNITNIPTLNISKIHHNSMSEENHSKTNDVSDNNSKPARMLDRYRSVTPRASSRLQFSLNSVHINRFQVFRESEWTNGIPKKKFYIKDPEKSDVIALASYSSVFSSLLLVSNHRGLLCEIDTDNKPNTYQMRLGNDIVFQIYLGPARSVIMEFYEMDGITPPYQVLVSPPSSCADISAAFGNRQAVKSIKNCKLCYKSEEILSIRKIDKHIVSVDSRSNVSMLACFALAIFMFST